MCDSTNAERPGFTMSEKTVGRTIDAILMIIRIQGSLLQLLHRM